MNLPRIANPETALHIAAQQVSVGVAALLIEAGADLEARTDDGGTALYMAASTDHVNVANLLIEAGVDIDARARVDIDARARRGGTPLIRAALSNAVGAIELLVAAGADIDGKLPAGRTALHQAAQEGRADATRRLIELGGRCERGARHRPLRRWAVRRCCAGLEDLDNDHAPAAAWARLWGNAGLIRLGC